MRRTIILLILIIDTIISIYYNTESDSLIIITALIASELMNISDNLYKNQNHE